MYWFMSLLIFMEIDWFYLELLNLCLDSEKSVSECLFYHIVVKCVLPLSNEVLKLGQNCASVMCIY